MVDPTLALIGGFVFGVIMGWKYHELYLSKKKAADLEKEKELSQLPPPPEGYAYVKVAPKDKPKKNLKNLMRF